jgi:hypothetical protein
MSFSALNDSLVVQLLAFTAAASGVVAQAEIAPPELRLGAGALAAGCAAVLALKKRPT